MRRHVRKVLGTAGVAIPLALTVACGSGAANASSPTGGESRTTASASPFKSSTPNAPTSSRTRLHVRIYCAVHLKGKCYSHGSHAGGVFLVQSSGFTRSTAQRQAAVITCGYYPSRLGGLPYTNWQNLVSYKGMDCSRGYIDRRGRIITGLSPGYWQWQPKQGVPGKFHGVDPWGFYPITFIDASTGKMVRAVLHIPR